MKIIRKQQLNVILLSTVFLNGLISSTKFIDEFFSPKYFFLFSITSVLLFFFTIKLYKKNSFSLNPIDIAVIGFNLWILTSSLLNKNVFLDNSYFYTIVCCSVFYFCVKFVFIDENGTGTDIKHLLFQLFIVIGTISSIYGLLQFFGVLDIKNPYFKMAGSFNNPGQLAIYLGSVFPISFSTLLFHKKIKILSLISSILIVTAIGLSGSRTAWICVFFVILFLIEKRYGFIKTFFWNKKNTILKLLGSILIIVFFCISCFHLYKYKQDSAHGRVFIWKVALSIINDKPVLGHGFNSFLSIHNKYQEQYFTDDKDDNKNYFVADSVNYAFNEFIQTICEIGAIGLIILLFLFAYPFIHTYNKFYEKEKGFLLGAQATIISIFIGSLFFYPLHIISVIVVFFFCLSVVSSYIEAKYKIIKVPRFLWITVLTTILFTTLCFFIVQSNRRNAEKKWLVAYNMMRSGEYAQAINKFNKIYPVLGYDKRFMFNLGCELYILGKYHDSIKVLENIKNNLYTPDLFIYLGLAYEEIGDFKKAIEAYKRASNIMPIKFYPKYRLVKIYDQMGKTNEAILYAEKIQNTPVKINSDIVQEIKKEMGEYLSNRR